MKRLKVLAVLMLLFGVSGCKEPAGRTEYGVIAGTAQDVQETAENIPTESKEIAACYMEIYEQALQEGTLGTLDTVRKIVKCLGDAGYTAVDAENQIDMVLAHQVVEFLGKVENQEEAETTIISVVETGDFIRYDLSTTGGEVTVTRSYVAWNGLSAEIQAKEQYPAHSLVYTQEGYLFFEEYHMAGYDGPPGQTAIRVQPLDEKCRELNRQYILPIGYELNNMFILDWDDADYGQLNFYDLFTMLYSGIYGRTMPYTSDENLEVGAVYHVPKEEFENVLTPYFQINSETLQAKTTYLEDSQSYEYRPRGLYDCEPPNIPYPEVVGYREIKDGTLLLTVHVVYPYEKQSKVYAHEVVIRPLADGKFQYVSNRMIPATDNHEESWHVNRLTDEEWAETYGE